jgi:predicted O-methyltransferase YrrM
MNIVQSPKPDVDTHRNCCAATRSKISLKTIENKVAGVDGWLSRTEGRLLFRLAKRCRARGAIVEIGSWKGKSTIWLGHGTREGRGQKIHAIDPHCGVIYKDETAEAKPTFADFQRNIAIAGVADMVIPHVDFSESVARTFSEPVEFIFIDGLHDYQSVKNDFETWFPKVMNGGVMAFHDTTGQPGPFKLVTENVFRSRHFRKIGFGASIVYAQKVERNTLIDRMGNRFMLGAFLVHAFIRRWRWRLTHNYLKFWFRHPTTQAAAVPVGE